MSKTSYLDALVDGSAPGAVEAPARRGAETPDIIAFGDVHNDDPGPPHTDNHIDLPDPPPSGGNPI